MASSTNLRVEIVAVSKCRPIHYYNGISVTQEKKITEHRT